MGKPKSLAEDHRRLLTDKLYCDVNFVVGDDEVMIQANRLILASRSKVFSAMFYGELKENGENVKLPDTNGVVLKLFLEYLYTDITHIDNKHVRDLLYLATKYDVQNLVDACESYCASTITLDEVCNTMNLATNYNLNGLWKACIQFVVIKNMHIFPSNYLDDLEVDTMKKFVACDELAVEEISIFKCLRSWAEQECSRQELEYNIANERSVLGQNIFSIRFPIIKSQRFTDIIATTNILTAEEEVDVHRSLTSGNKMASKYFPNCPRFNVQGSFGWRGSFINNDIRPFHAPKIFTLKSVVLRVSCSEVVYLRFTTKESTHFGCADIDFAYEVECPTKYINKCIHVPFPNNGIKVDRKADIKFIDNCYSFRINPKRKKIKVSNVFEEIESDDQLLAMFSFEDIRKGKEERPTSSRNKNCIND